MKNWKWTTPYYGVTHLDRGHGTGLRPQFTVADYETFSQATHFPPGGGFSGVSKDFRGPDRVNQAKKWLEDQARIYN